MNESNEEMEARLRAIVSADYCGVTWPKDRAAIRYALRAIAERRELLAALRNVVADGHDEDWTEEWRLIAKCEAP